jgi:hypothetical protein
MELPQIYLPLVDFENVNCIVPKNERERLWHCGYTVGAGGNLRKSFLYENFVRIEYISNNSLRVSMFWL